MEITTDTIDSNDGDLVYTPEELAAAELAVYAAAGLTKQNRAGELVPDNIAMRDRVYELVMSCVVNDRTEMSRKGKSLTNTELYALVFPGAPGTNPKQLIAELTPLERELRSKLRRAVWNLTNPNRKGSIQSRIGKEGRTQILIRTDVQRGVEEIPGVFVTDNADLIIKESLEPVVEKLLTAAKELRLHNQVVVEDRHPELAPRVTAALNVAKTKVNAELDRPSIRTAPQLGPPAATDSAE